MATRFAVASGNWDGTTTSIWAATSGGAPGASAPTSADDVVFDANSGAINVNVVSSAATANNLTLTGFTGTLGGGGTLVILGNIVLANTCTLSSLLLQSAPATGTTKTLTSNAKTVAAFEIKGTGTGVTQLSDAFPGGGALIHTQGTFDTANFSVTCNTFSSSNTNTRTLTLGSSNITVNGTGTTQWQMVTSTGLTITANTATITLSGSTPVFNQGFLPMNGASVIFTGAGNAQYVNPATLANLTRTGTAIKTDQLTVSNPVTVTGTFTVTGNSATNRVLVQSSLTGISRTITAASVSFSNVDFMDIAGAGAANWNLSAITGGSGDAGGNSGITFTAGVQQFWRNNGGNWSDATHWSLTSGGGATGRVPLPQDNVRFDANSFSLTAQTVTLDMPRSGADVDWTGATNAPTWTSSLAFTAFGSVTWISTVARGSWTGGFTLAGRGTHTHISAGVAQTAVTFQGPGGTYTLLDAFNNLGTINQVAGTLNTNGMAVTCSTFTSAGTLTRALTLGTSTVSLTATTATTVWNVTATGLTLSAASSTIAISGASANTKTFGSTSGALTYGTLTYTVAASTGVLSLSVSTGTTFGTINVSGGSRTLWLNSGSTLNVTNWNVFGLVGAVVTVSSNISGTAATISKASGYIASDYVSVQDITGTGGATYYMGSRSTSVSGNTGLTFTDAPQRFWVGGTATWDATVGTKWAVVSGGTGGIAVPTSNEDVYFDANSGASTIGVAGGNVALAKNFILTGFAGTWNGSGTVGVAGTALTLGASMTATSLLISLGGQAASSTCTVTSAGKAFAQFSTFTGTTVTTALADAFSVTGTLTHTSGTFTTNNFAITCGTFTSSNTNVRTLNMGSSSFTVTSTNGFTATVTNLTLNAGTSVLSVFSIASSGGLITFYDVVLQSNGGLASLSSAGMTCHNLTRGTAAVKTDVMQIRSGATVTVTGTLTATGNSATNRLLVQSNTVGTSVTINAATVSMSNIDFMDIAATGTANWDLSAITGGSGDAGGNSGITFTTGAVNYWVGGTGNWSDITHWANSSGGVGGTGRVPLPQGTARFDANSFTAAAQTVTTDMPRAAKDIDWTGATNTPTWTNSIAGGYAIYGSLTMISSMTLVGGTSGPLFNGRGTHTLTSAGKTIQNSINFSSPGATYTMQDAFGTIGSSGITFNAGTLNTGGFTLTTPIFSSGGGGTRTVTLSTSTVNLTATSGTPWNVTAAGFTLSAASSTIVLSVASASTRSFTSTGGAQAYGTLTYTVAASTGRLAMSTSIGTSFTAINVSGGVRELNFTSGTSTTVTSWNVFGTSGALVLVTASTPGTQATLVKSDGVAVSSNYVNVQDIAASPANTWYAAPGSVNSGNNSGWIFNQAYSVSTADSAPATDAATSRIASPRSTADTASTTDVVARSAFSSSRATADAAPAVDTAKAKVVASRATADAAPAVDTAKAKVVASRSLSDTAPVVDTVKAKVGTSRATADTAHATDAVTTRLRAVLALTEGMSLSDAVTFIFAVSLRLKDHRSGSWQPTSRLKWYDTSTHTWRVMRIKRNITSTGAWVPAQMESP